MAFSLSLPPKLEKQGWKVKIRDKERGEEAHVSILRRKQTWRWTLRRQHFMDRIPLPREIPEELLDFVRKNLELLAVKWDEMYPHNVVDESGGES